MTRQQLLSSIYTLIIVVLRCFASTPVLFGRVFLRVKEPIIQRRKPSSLFIARDTRLYSVFRSGAK